MSITSATPAAISRPVWDMAGRDGLHLARSLFGEAVDYLAPFQSLETTLQGHPCSVLRLCERNFRLSCGGAVDAAVVPLTVSVWFKQVPWMAGIVLPDALVPAVMASATVRPPHRLDLPLNRAVPARLQGIPVLLWRHAPDGEASLEVHLARESVDALVAGLGG